MEQTCLYCHHFKLDDLQSGVCRLQKGKDAPRPLKKLDDSCENWRDAGQQYFIRLGWLEAERKRQGEAISH